MNVITLVYLCALQGQASMCRLDAVIEIPARSCLDMKNIAESEISAYSTVITKVYCVPKMFVPLDFKP